MNRKGTMRRWSKQLAHGVGWVLVPAGVAECQHACWVWYMYYFTGLYSGFSATPARPLGLDPTGERPIHLIELNADAGSKSFYSCRSI